MQMVAETRTQIKRRVLRELKQELGGKIVGMKLMPLAAALGDLVSEDGLSCSVAGEWFVVNTKSKQQRLAQESIAAAGLPVYLPIIRKNEMHGRGRLITVERPMFGPYLFARCQSDPEDWQRITAARGVQRLLDITGNGRPGAVPYGAIEVIRLIEAERNAPEQKMQVSWHFTVGDTVRIKTGPFAEFYAKVNSAVDEHGRIWALVDVFGRKTPSQFDADQLEAR